MEANTDRDRVVVGVDGSESSIDALRYAARLADAFGAPLEAVITWLYPRYTDPTIIPESSFEQQATAVLDAAVVRAFGDEVPEGLARTVLPGPAARTLIDLSGSSGMLVVGSRGHGGFAGILLGSVSAACAEHAHCPVVVVHTQPESKADRKAESKADRKADRKDDSA